MATPKGGTRAKNPRGSGDVLRRQLLDAANAILDRTGDAADVTVRGVAAAVGVSPNAVYLHFADRDELLAEVVIDRFQAFGDHLRAAAAAAGDDDVAVLRAGHNAYIEFAAEHPGHYRLLFGRGEVNPDRPELAQRVLEVAYAAFQVCIDACQRCVDAGLVGDVDVMTLAHTVWALEHGYVDLVGTVKGSILPSPDAILDMLLASIRPATS